MSRIVSEKLHPDPAGDGQVVREIIPGGYEPRLFKLYPNHASARMVQWLSGKRLVPDFVVTLVDDGVPVSHDYLDREPVSEQEFYDAA